MKAIYKGKLLTVTDDDWNGLTLEDGSYANYEDEELIVDPTDKQIAQWGGWDDLGCAEEVFAPQGEDQTRQRRERLVLALAHRFTEDMRKAVEENDAELAGALCDKFRRAGATYAEIRRIFTNYANCPAEVFERLMNEAGAQRLSLWEISNQKSEVGAPSEDLRAAIAQGQAALAGESNDAEHDALYALIQALTPAEKSENQKPMDDNARRDLINRRCREALSKPTPFRWERLGY